MPPGNSKKQQQQNLGQPPNFQKLTTENHDFLGERRFWDYFFSFLKSTKNGIFCLLETHKTQHKETETDFPIF